MSKNLHYLLTRRLTAFDRIIMKGSGGKDDIDLEYGLCIWRGKGGGTNGGSGGGGGGDDANLF